MNIIKIYDSRQEKKFQKILSNNNWKVKKTFVSEIAIQTKLMAVNKIQSIFAIDIQYTQLHDVDMNVCTESSE
jgi:hypothetical protein